MDKKQLFEDAIQSILNFDSKKAEATAKLAISQGFNPVEVISEGFTAGITKVGDLFGRGELFLPELIRASEVMKTATGILNAAIATGAAQKKGKILIATVEGDIHDIGKGIVVSLLIANGFEVLDLGRDVKTETIIEKALEFEADIIGTSALLTTTLEGQKKLEMDLKKAGLRDRFKTIVGGAPCTQRWADRIGANAYCEDAHEAVVKSKMLLGM
ncbi:MAG: corrinoid protein [Desulfocucumaceae bacterium]